MAFEVGQMVVCVDDDAWTVADRTRHIYPHRGMIYTVRESFPSPIDGIPVLRLEEIVQPISFSWRGELTEPYFKASRFRPIRHTDISIFTEALTKLPEKV